MHSPLLCRAFLGAFIGFLNQSQLGISSQDLARVNYYWDRRTGVLVECSYFAFEQVGNWSSSWLMFYVLIESNAWIVPEYPMSLRDSGDLVWQSRLNFLLRRWLVSLISPSCHQHALTTQIQKHKVLRKLI